MRSTCKKCTVAFKTEKTAQGGGAKALRGVEGVFFSYNGEAKMGSSTLGNQILSSYKERVRDDEEKVLHDRQFLHYLREDMCRCLGYNKCVDIHMTDCCHDFGDEEFPLRFTLVLTFANGLRHNGEDKKFFLNFRGRAGGRDGYKLELMDGRLPREKFDIIFQDKKETNFPVYQKIFLYFQKQFGEKGEHPFTMDEKANSEAGKGDSQGS